jgi:hypothetical protein
LISSITIQSASRACRAARGHRADDADGEAGPGERAAAAPSVRQAQLLADLAHLVLEQVAQRLDELEAEVLGEAADVVVGLDLWAAFVSGGRGLDDVG